MTFQLVMAQVLVVLVMLLIMSAAIAAAHGKRGMFVISTAMLAGGAFLAAGALFELEGARLWEHSAAAAVIALLVAATVWRALRQDKSDSNP